MSEQQLYAAPTNPYALNQGELDRLRARVSKAEAGIRVAKDPDLRRELEQSAKTLRRELRSAELARREEDRASQRRFDRRYMSVNESKGLPEFALPQPYFSMPEASKPKAPAAKEKGKQVCNRAVPSPQSFSARTALVREAMDELRRQAT